MDLVMEKEAAIKELGEFYNELYGDELIYDEINSQNKLIIDRILDGLTKGFVIISKNDNGDNFFKVKLKSKYSYGTSEIEELDLFEPLAKDLNSIKIDRETIAPFQTNNELVKKCISLKYQGLIDKLKVRELHYLTAATLFLAGHLNSNIPS